MSRNIICFSLTESKESDEYGQAGWNYDLLIQLSSNLNFNVYHITSDKSCFIVKDKIFKIPIQEILDIVPDYFIARAYFEFGILESIFNKSKNKIYIYAQRKRYNDIINKKFDRILDENNFFKPIPNSNIFLKIEDFKKEYIIYPGSILPRKNQLEFLENIDVDLIKKYKIVFCGKIKDRKYLRALVNTAHKKGINILIPNSKYPEIIKKYGDGYLKHDELNYFLKKSKCLVLISNGDSNPKSLIEGIFAGIPFITSKKTRLNSKYLKFGLQIEIDQLNSSISKILKKEISFSRVDQDFINLHSNEYFIKNSLGIT